MKIYQALFLIFATSLLSTCTKKEKKYFIKTYYPSGNLLSSGWYTNDSIPIDTIYKFYENGKLFSISIYDTSGTGKLNGTSILFYENGSPFQKSTYSKGKLQGFLFEYNKSGVLHVKQFYVDDKPIGDNYNYDNNGNLSHYAFYWTDTAFLNYIEYDSIGMIKNEFDSRPVLFNYITVIKNDTADNKINKICHIKIVPSNPPHCLTKVNIDFISVNGKILKQDSISNVELYDKQLFLPDSLRLIKYYGIQYDSITKKYYNGRIETTKL